MNVSQLSLIFAMLSFAALAGGLAVIGLLVTGRVEKLVPFRDLLLPIAFGVALVCTLGSLYYSAVAHFQPCRLCWWQRISMYPLVAILGVGVLRRDRTAAFYGLPLALMGLAGRPITLSCDGSPGKARRVKPRPPAPRYG
jgi:hypothetical protein